MKILITLFSISLSLSFVAQIGSTLSKEALRAKRILITTEIATLEKNLIDSEDKLTSSISKAKKDEAGLAKREVAIMLNKTKIYAQKADMGDYDLETIDKTIQNQKKEKRSLE